MVGAAFSATLLLIGSTALAIWWTARQDARPSSDAIVVLGSAQYNGVPSSIFEARLEHAMRAARMAEDAGMEVTSSPTRRGPAVQTRTTQFKYILRETAAYLLYRATGESVAGAPGIG